MVAAAVVGVGCLSVYMLLLEAPYISCVLPCTHHYIVQPDTFVSATFATCTDYTCYSRIHLSRHENKKYAEWSGSVGNTPYLNCREVISRSLYDSVHLVRSLCCCCSLRKLPLLPLRLPLQKLLVGNQRLTWQETHENLRSLLLTWSETLDDSAPNGDDGLDVVWVSRSQEAEMRAEAHVT